MALFRAEALSLPSPPVELGSGGFGKVYRGALLEKPVAVKVLPSHNAEQAQRVRNELAILREIRGPYLVQMWGVVARETSILLCTELCDIDLDKMLLASSSDGIKNTTPAQRLRWAAQAATGLAFLHERVPAIIHGDLKPSNLLYCKVDDVVKISDFGLSHLMSAPAHGATPYYAAPEVIQRVTLADQRPSDVYSLGVTLWEILTCTRITAAFSADHWQPTPRELAIDKAKPKLAGKRSLGLNGDVVDTIQSCLSLDPEERPPVSVVSARLSEAYPICRINELIADDQARQFWRHYLISTDFHPEVSVKVFFPRFYSYLNLTEHSTSSPSSSPATSTTDSASLLDSIIATQFPSSGPESSPSLSSSISPLETSISSETIPTELTSSSSTSISSSSSPSTSTSSSSTSSTSTSSSPSTSSSSSSSSPIDYLTGNLSYEYSTQTNEPKTDGEKRHKMLEILLADQGKVSAERFGKFVTRFGPFDADIVKRAEEICKIPQFHGELNRIMLSTILRSAYQANPAPCHLLRFSMSNPHGYTLSWVKQKPDGNIDISNLPIERDESGLFRSADGIAAPSLQEYLELRGPSFGTGVRSRFEFLSSSSS